MYSEIVLVRKLDYLLFPIISIIYYNIDRKEPLVNIGDFVVEKERNYEWEVTNIYKDKYEGIWYISVRCPISLQKYMSHSEFYKTFNTSK